MFPLGIRNQGCELHNIDLNYLIWVTNFNSYNTKIKIDCVRKENDFVLCILGGGKSILKRMCWCQCVVSICSSNHKCSILSERVALSFYNIMYNIMLDTGVINSTYSVILKSQKGSIEALNFLIIGIDYTIGFINFMIT